MDADKKWEERFYFDDYISFNGLRIVQRECGPENVRLYGDLFIGEARLRLLNTVSLFPLVCGAGKTILMVSVLLAINEQVKLKIGNGPRAGKVLWMVKEKLLGVMLKHELETEIVKYGLHHRKPDVVIYDETGDVDYGPLHHDIVIMCPNALWETKAKSNRSAENVMGVLAKWDVIIWDECDFADEQVKRLAALAPHALKFGLTASPIDADGELLRHFAVASYATYSRVFDDDHCLKKLLPWKDASDKAYIREIAYDDYARFDSAKIVQMKGKHLDNQSLPGSIAAIRAAILDCHALEQAMRREWPDNWYSPHIFVKCSQKKECEHLCAHTNEQLALLNLSGEGWRAAQIWDGFKTDKREETHLFHKDSNVIHPFMRATLIPELRGRCDSRSARLLFGVDMAVRGMNCWPLLFLVDIERGESVNVQVQFKGRDGRWPKFLSHLVTHKLFEHFGTGRYYRPDSGGSVGAMQAAYDFIFNMEDRIGEAQLLDWNDVLNGESINSQWKVPGFTTPFSMTDQMQVDTQLGEIIEAGAEPTEKDIDNIVASLPGYNDPEGNRINNIKEHIDNVLDPGPDGKDYRDSIRHPKFSVIKPIFLEEPKPIDQYTIAELKSFIEQHPKWAQFCDDIVKELETSSTLKKMVAADLLERNKILFRQVSKVAQLHEANGRPGIITSMSNKWAYEFYKRGILEKNKKNGGEIRRAVNTAVAMICRAPGKNPTRNDGPIDRPSYHHALGMPNTQHTIKKLVCSILRNNGIMSKAAALYAAYDQKEQTNAAE